MIKEILNKANWLTYLGVIASIIGISMCFLNKTEIAIICLMISGICDAFDGTIARKIRKEEENNFGVELDSLADIISSGIFPIIICLSLGFSSLLSIIVYMIFILTGVTRLAYYNTNTHEDNKFFVGLPITTSTILIPILYLLKCKEVFFISAIFILSILYILPFKIKKINLVTKITLTIFAIIITLIMIGELI